MITYFHKRKGSLDACEDSLTSSVFDLLKYLPAEIFWSILKKSLYYDKLPETCGELIGISFWEKWDASNTYNIRLVEPDVFLSFKEFDIIVEAKRLNEGQQYSKQWNNQIQAYLNEFGGDSKMLLYIQLGGLRNLKDEPNLKVGELDLIVCKTDWSKLLNQIIAHLKLIESPNSSQQQAHKRLLIDLVKCFELHGFYRKTWLCEITTDLQTNIHEINNFANYARRKR